MGFAHSGCYPHMNLDLFTVLFWASHVCPGDARDTVCNPFLGRYPGLLGFCLSTTNCLQPAGMLAFSALQNSTHLSPATAFRQPLLDLFFTPYLQLKQSVSLCGSYNYNWAHVDSQDAHLSSKESATAASKLDPSSPS